MNPNSQHIRTAFERTLQVVKKKPSTGQVTRKAKARITGGLACEVREEDWVLTADEPDVLGGTNSGPTPGVLSRMGLASCLAIGYAIQLSREEIPYQGIEVEVEGDVDFRGLLGIDDAIPPGHPELRITAHVVSGAPREAIERALEYSERHSFGMHWTTQAVPVKRALNLTMPDHKAGAAD